jgi:hypothetical protein
MKNITNDKRIRIISGHYGSGKTEFAINYALELSKYSKNIAIIDLDIVNPYFRTREKAEILEQKGIKVISSSIGHQSSLDIPALSAGIATPLQDKSFDVIIDLGGDAVGARVLGRYKKNIENQDYDMFGVVNCFRAQTQTADDVVSHLRSIEQVTGLYFTSLINNSHLLRDTKIENVIHGQKILEKVSQAMSIPAKYTCILEGILAKEQSGQIYKANHGLAGEIFEIKLYMREEWM